MADCTQADWVLIGAQFAEFALKLPNRVLAHLRLGALGLRGGFSSREHGIEPLADAE